MLCYILLTLSYTAVYSNSYTFAYDFSFLIMEQNKYEQLLLQHDIKPTANRIIIVRTLDGAGKPVSMKELEYSILSLDKSSIFRTLVVFKQHHLVHVIEDGEGGVKYELCHSHDEDIDDDEHMHFYCEHCHSMICLHDMPLPCVELPSDFELHSVNFIIRGICPECRKKKG